MDEVRLGKKNHKSSPNLAWQPLHCLRAWKKNWWKLLGLRDWDLYDSSDASHEIQVSYVFSQIWDLVVKSQCTMRNWSEKDWLENNKTIFTHSLVDVVGPFFTLSLDDLSYAWPQKDLTNGLFFIIVSCFYLLKHYTTKHYKRTKTQEKEKKHTMEVE